MSRDETIAVGAKNVRMRSRFSYVDVRRATRRKHPSSTTFLRRLSPELPRDTTSVFITDEVAANHSRSPRMKTRIGTLLTLVRAGARA